MSRAIVLAALAALLTAAAPASAEPPVSLPIDVDWMARAYAPGHVLVAEPEPFGANAIIVRDLGPADHSNRVLLAIPYPPEQTRPSVSLVANATGYLIALRGDDDAFRMILGGYDGSQRPVFACTVERDTADVQMTAGTIGFAFAGAPCGDGGVKTVGADGSLAPVASEGELRTLALAEPFLAVYAGDTIQVHDLSTGAERRLPANEAAALAVAPDGTVVTHAFRPASGLYAWPPAAPTPTLLTNRSREGLLAVAGGKVVFTNQSGAAGVIDLAGGAPRAVGAPGAGDPRVLGMDGRHVALNSDSCQGDAQVTVVDLAEPRAGRGVNGCPVTLARRSLRFSSSGTAAVSVRCPNGCRGELRLSERSTRRRPCDGLAVRICRTIAIAPLEFPPSRRAHRVRFRLEPAAGKLHGRRLGVRTNEGDYSWLTIHGGITRVSL